MHCRLFLGLIGKNLPKNLKISFKSLKKSHAIVWIMVKPNPSTNKTNNGRATLETKTYFSTLEHAAVPNSPTDLFSPLVLQLIKEWEDVCTAADQHLSYMVLLNFSFENLN